MSCSLNSLKGVLFGLGFRGLGLGSKLLKRGVRRGLYRGVLKRFLGGNSEFGQQRISGLGFRV